MNGHLETVQQYEGRPAGSPVRVKADPNLVSDVSVSCSTPTQPQQTSRTHYEATVDWESVISDLPSDDEDG